MPEKKRDLLGLFLGYMGPYKREMAFVYVLYLLNSMLNLGPAFAVRFFIDIFLTGQPASFFGLKLASIAGQPTALKISMSLIFLACMAGLILIANSIGVTMWRLGTKVTEKIIYDMKISLHNHINKLSIGFFHRERTGDIMTKVVGDAANFGMFLKNSFNLIYGVIQFCLAPFLMISQSPLLFLVAIIPMPIILFAFYNIRYGLKPLYKKVREQESMINSRVQESVTGIREIKAFNMENLTERSYGDVNMDYYNIQNRIMRIFSFNHQLQYGAKDLGLVLIVVLGGILTWKGIGGITVGVIASMTVMAGFIYGPISMFLMFWDTIQRGMVSLERIHDFLKVEPDVKDHKNALVLKRQDVKGSVKYENIWFAYEKNKYVLEDISFDVRSGEKIAIVGPTGSGKSTLLSLLSRFYEPDKGAIYVDGRDIKDYTQESLRQAIGIVFQDTFLFYGNIQDNLLFPNPGRTEEEMIQACKAANIHDHIMTLPEGYLTVVGERGVTLSGGERQRLAIARVFLRDPVIVILDEATSAVDNVTERLIQESIEGMLHGRTAFIIAHRLGTIRKCDRIVVMQEHKITEIGTHDELLQKQGMYYRLHETASL